MKFATISLLGLVGPHCAAHGACHAATRALSGARAAAAGARAAAAARAARAAATQAVAPCALRTSITAACLFIVATVSG
eukprot:CAMPEP_0115251930 /NCGR_PEP_ID=MMETSP0270-20121206/43888_1 /TAXON_ID=71861 /ORGANISM="Scrippsiella trochoidea, Strain CCMP3099" /LENGTH=78 /DNA_ID=CAMNT_0002667375 /DNA_START=160 /DNA_END=392 /DNA_ORIENTATION=+